MRFGNWRGFAAAVALLTSWAAGASADWGIGDAFDWMHTIPRVTYAKDYRTGGQYYAPPVPYGHYAKDPIGQAHAAASGAIHGAAGHLKGAASHVGNAVGTLCGACGGKGCGACGGDGLLGGDLNGANGGCAACGDGIALAGHPIGGPINFAGGYGAGAPYGGYAPAGYTTSGGHGLLGGLKSKFFGHKGGAVSYPAGVGHGFGHGAVASPQSSPVASPQVGPSGQTVGCLDGLGHGHGGGQGLAAGHGLLGKHDGGVFGAGGNVCGPCGGRGLFNGGVCGPCGGDGLCGNGNDPCGPGGMCGGCGGAGHLNGQKCGLCGGSGLCAALGGLKGKAHGALGYLKGLHPKNQVKYFVGAGGPVPLTPGYVPYINPVRSPRDFFAFPPFSDRALDGGAETSPYGAGITRNLSSVVVPPPPAPAIPAATGDAFPLGGRAGGGAPEAGLGAGGDEQPMDDRLENRGQAQDVGIPTTPPTDPIPPAPGLGGDATRRP